MTTKKISNVLWHCNQFEYRDNNKAVFQSYESICCIVDYAKQLITFWKHWDYSKTTLKHLKAFLCYSGSKKDLQKALELWELRGMKLIYDWELI